MQITRDPDNRQGPAVSVTETSCGASLTFGFILDPPAAVPALEQRAFALARAVAELPLSPREKELMLEIGKGRTNAAIARALKISPATVKTHLEHIYEKLGVSGRVAALARALATRISTAIAVSYASVVSLGLSEQTAPLFI